MSATRIRVANHSKNDVCTMVTKTHAPPTKTTATTPSHVDVTQKRANREIDPATLERRTRSRGGLRSGDQ